MSAELDRERARKRARRRHDGADTGDDYRFPAEKDRDRILYSPEFRRLAGVTQVAAPHERHLVHNRLTHSLKVAQMGRRIAERLIRADPGLKKFAIDPDVVEAAGLAHDIGHPPFGHAAERALQDIFREETGEELGFEGNAQTFRIVTELSTRHETHPGLDLTRATLAAILKYPQFAPPADEKIAFTDRSRGTKWGAYRTEEKDFRFAVGPPPATGRAGVRSPNAIIMDWADDISFATHDLEDFIHAGAVGPETLLADWPNLIDFVRASLSRKTGFEPSDFNTAQDAVHEVFAGRFPRMYEGSRKDRADVHEIISDWIHQLDRGCYSRRQAPFVFVKRSSQYVAEILKNITTYYVVRHPSIHSAEVGHQHLIRKLHKALAGTLVKAPTSRYGHPRSLWDIYDRLRKGADDMMSVHRATADYICSLTENQAIDLYARLSGKSQSLSLGAWLR